MGHGRIGGLSGRLTFPAASAVYASRFSDATRDMYLGDHNVVRDHIGFQAADPARSLERAVNWSQHVACHAWWGLTEVNGDLRVQTFVNPARYSDAPGAPPSGVDGEVLAQRFDVQVTGHGMPVVSIARWAAEAFRRLPEVIVATVPSLQ